MRELTCKPEYFDFFFFFSCHGWVRQKNPAFKDSRNFLINKNKIKYFSNSQLFPIISILEHCWMDKDKVNTEVKLSLLWKYGLNQLFKKKIRQVTAHLLYIKLRSWYMYIYRYIYIYIYIIYIHTHIDTYICIPTL